MPPKDCELAAAVHTMVTEEAPELDAPTFYGMPASEGADGVVLFVQASSKFGARYTTLLASRRTPSLTTAPCGQRATPSKSVTRTPGHGSVNSSAARFTKYVRRGRRGRRLHRP